MYERWWPLSLPSAGVGTAISREVLDYLSEQNRNQVFDITSLTEDYMMGIRLHDFSGKKIFLQQNVPSLNPEPLRFRDAQRRTRP